MWLVLAAPGGSGVSFKPPTLAAKMMERQHHTPLGLQWLQE
jgi:hypothetical protein